MFDRHPYLQKRSRSIAPFSIVPNLRLDPPVACHELLEQRIFRPIRKQHLSIGIHLTRVFFSYYVLIQDINDYLLPVIVKRTICDGPLTKC
jgi:hypothetical protein